MANMSATDMTVSAKTKKSSPLCQWIQEYSRAHGITLTELSRDAGLSDGTLRSLMYHPDRLPTMETCLRLARATGEPARTLLQLAGLPVSAEIEQYDLDRINLLKIYNELPKPMRRMLLEIAITLRQNMAGQPPDSSLRSIGEP